MARLLGNIAASLAARGRRTKPRSAPAVVFAPRTAGKGAGRIDAGLRHAAFSAPSRMN